MHVEAHPGESEKWIQTEISRLIREGIVKRLWTRDHTVWDAKPKDISDRLGWLSITEQMRVQTGDLINFAKDVRREGFSSVLLLGIGGSSLAGEALHSVFNRVNTYPEFSVLDSTLPDSIRATVNTIDPANTLFIVSSKSGTTMEPIFLYKYFRTLVEQTKRKDAGANFVAITDPNTPLDHAGKQGKFRKMFLNPPSLGGRFSVLSFFGLLPGVLFGLDIEKLMDRADAMRLDCAAFAEENPGLYLGAAIGALAGKGRDKLTLVSSPSLRGFEDWVEQLIAESTGKQGKGIIPVTGEPLISPELYGQDRLFVYNRLETDDNDAIDKAISRLKAYGHPVIILAMKDKFDMGAQFFLWEFAIAVTGNVIGVNPFNQPDVNGAKDTTGKLLYRYIQQKELPVSGHRNSLADLLGRAGSGKYFSIMAFIPKTHNSNKALAQVRKNLLERYQVATTLGYGPSFLHSTGQLHKGGPDNGLFLQITSSHEHDIPIPGLPFSFGVVADAQALGDIQALEMLGRRVASHHLQQSDANSIRTTLDELFCATA